MEGWWRVRTEMEDAERPSKIVNQFGSIRNDDHRFNVTTFQQKSGPEAAKR